MRCSLPGVFVRALFLMAVGGLCVRGVAWAQSQEKPAENRQPQATTEPKKPTRNTGWVITDDGVALLAVRRAASAVGTSPTEARAVAAKVESRPEEEAERRKAEIASLQKEVAERQKRIGLLMRLFVKDEQGFLKDPGNTGGDPEVKERRKYEQDELLYETAELAKVKERLGELVTDGNDK